MPDYRSLPSVDALARSPDLSAYPEAVRVAAAREAVKSAREAIGKNRAGDPLEAAVRIAGQMTQSSLRPVINLSGVILHTGLGRARLAESAVRQVTEAARAHASVELDLETGARGDRQNHVRGHLHALTGAEDATVVNNNAAAVFLSLHALANRKGVLLSRGQMVEIGGSFRMPDIVRQSGCKLVEVGTTNRTRIEDYEAAITPQTAAILRCHPSNFKVVGFTEEPSAHELAELAHRRGLVLVEDVGSGCLADTTRWGLPKEPTLGDAIAAGADIVTASGDKLLGGPQAGIILGKASLIQKIKKHPLARALRIDKLTLAALEATLMLYSAGQEGEIPTLRYLSRNLEELKEICERLRQAYQGNSSVSEGITEVGGGSLPGAGVPTIRLGLKAKSPRAAAKALRCFNPPILTRIESDQVWLDPRTLEPSEIDAVETALRELRC